jgi:hypothetical protein
MRPNGTLDAFCSLDLAHLSSYICHGLGVAACILLRCTGVGVGMQTAHQGLVSGGRCLLRDVTPHQTDG